MTRLLAAVLAGSLAEGDRLVIQKVATQLGVSATPVREALVSLADMGIVRLLPNRGAVCLPFGSDQLREIFQIRRILEEEAIRIACGAIDQWELDQLESAMNELLGRRGLGVAGSEAALALDQRLHHLVYERCGSARLQHELRRYELLMQGIRRHVGNELNLQQRALAEHLSIIRALRERDAEAAAREMARHIRNTARDVEQLMFPDPV